MMDIKSILFFIGGIFTIFCAIMDFEWFMNHPKAVLLIKILSRTGARILYIIVGIVFILIGLNIVSSQAP